MASPQTSAVASCFEVLTVLLASGLAPAHYVLAPVRACGPLFPRCACPSPPVCSLVPGPSGRRGVVPSGCVPAPLRQRMGARARLKFLALCLAGWRAVLHTMSPHISDTCLPLPGLLHACADRGAACSRLGAARRAPCRTVGLQAGGLRAEGKTAAAAAKSTETRSSTAQAWPPLQGLAAVSACRN